jgi:hypothetical protein
MRIEVNGITITDVPGLESIKIEPSGDESLVRIVIADQRNEHPQAWSIDALSAYRNAINRALREAIEMSEDIDRQMAEDIDHG